MNDQSVYFYNHVKTEKTKVFRLVHGVPNTIIRRSYQEYDLPLHWFRNVEYKIFSELNGQPFGPVQTYCDTGALYSSAEIVFGYFEQTLARYAPPCKEVEFMISAVYKDIPILSFNRGELDTFRFYGYKCYPIPEKEVFYYEGVKTSEDDSWKYVIQSRKSDPFIIASSRLTREENLKTLRDIGETIIESDLLPFVLSE